MDEHNILPAEPFIDVICEPLPAGGRGQVVRGRMDVA
jgi:hypothetical protein